MVIKKVAIIGMGALGLLYADQIQNKMGEDAVVFVMDEARLKRHRTDTYTINGEKKNFRMADPHMAGKADLIIFATKSNGLESAVDMAGALMHENTIFLSVLNGISSEQMIAERYGDKNLIYCIALGMDAMRTDTSLNYVNKGRLQIGITKEMQRPAFEAVKEFLTGIGQPYETPDDILHALWGKFMLNVGINQTCMVYDTNYYGAAHEPEYLKMMQSAMQEVIDIANAEQIHLTQKDCDYYLEIIKTLKPDGYPSMKQDAVAKRKSEVDLFAGTVIRLAQKHGISVPVNTFYYERIKEIESAYEKKGE